jgi:DNA-binding NarL/FixJ family response regulator
VGKDEQNSSAARHSAYTFTCIIYQLLHILKDCEAFLTRILIADDRTLMRDALKAMFALRPNWQVCGEAQDFHELLAKARQLRPDVIIVDFKMPPFNAIEAIRNLSDAMPSIPIVMYTLYKTEELEAAAKSAGVRAVVEKEHGVRHLLAAIDAELEHQTAQG